MRKPIMKVPYSDLLYGKKHGVTLKEAKKAYLSGMSKKFRKEMNIKFVRR